MSSRASALESPKASGDALEAHVIQATDVLEFVGDRTATWHDARTAALLEPHRSLPFYGIVLVEPDVPVEIKGCQIETSNGSGSTRGRFYVKRAAHAQLLEAGGMYLLVVYLPRPGLPQVARAVVPATLIDERLSGRWYEIDGSRSEQEVAYVVARDRSGGRRSVGDRGVFAMRAVSHPSSGTERTVGNEEMAVIGPFRGWAIETVDDRHSIVGAGVGYHHGLYRPLSLQALRPATKQDGGSR